jgi:hypothetical protein
MYSIPIDTKHVKPKQVFRMNFDRFERNMLVCLGTRCSVRLLDIMLQGQNMGTPRFFYHQYAVTIMMKVKTHLSYLMRMPYLRLEN